MTTKVLMTTVMQKRRAQWSLLPKTPSTKSADGPADCDTMAKTRPLAAAGSAAGAGSAQPR